MEKAGIQNNYRNKYPGKECEKAIYIDHKIHGHDNSDDDSEKRKKLLRNKSPDGLNIRSTPLNNITGVVLPMPGKRQVHYVLKELVSHALN